MLAFSGLRYTRPPKITAVVNKPG